MLSPLRHPCTPNEMRSKLPELKRETVNPFKEEIRERDWSNELKGKLYADEKRGGVSKSINVGDEVLLRAEKSNKLSTNFRLSPFKVVRKTESKITVKNDIGVEFQRNAEFVKKYHAQEGPTSGVENGGSEGASAGAGEAQDKRSSDVTLRAEPPVVFFFTEEEKRRLCPNRVNSLKPPQPELLD